MLVKTAEMNNGMIAGCCIAEFVSIPDINSVCERANEAIIQNAQLFFNAVNEYCISAVSENSVAELLWITEKVEKQAFKSKVRIFLVLRKIGTNAQLVIDDLKQIQKGFISTLSSGMYLLKPININDENFLNVVSEVNNNSVRSITKKERVKAGSFSLMPYFSFDVLPNEPSDNFDSIITSLSMEENMAISFQIFPTKLSQNQMINLTEYASQLSNIVNGFQHNRQFVKDPMAQEAHKVFTYYLEKTQLPIFNYNIVVWGSAVNSQSIIAKITGLLNTGKKRICDCMFDFIDFSNMKLNLFNNFISYPWIIKSQSSLINNRKPVFSKFPFFSSFSQFLGIMTSEEVNMFFRLPLYKQEFPYLSGKPTNVVNEEFKPSVLDKNNVVLGQLKSEKSISICISNKALTKHALIVGTPGSGKTTFSINLLFQFYKKKIPFLAIEPTKSEYRALIDVIPDIQIFTPGNSAVSPYIVNPFIPPKGIPIEKYIPSLASAFKAAFSMPEPLDMLFMKSIRDCYIKYGWKDYSKIGDEDVTVFGMHEFVMEFKANIKNTEYAKEVRSNLESAGVLRLTNLLEQNSNIYDNINTVPIEDILTKPTVIELNAIDNKEQKALLVALLLINICVYTKHNHIGDGKLKNAILIDEAHVVFKGSNISSNSSAKGQEMTVSTLEDMIAEIRSYGTSMLIADQSPLEVSHNVVANTDLKVVFKLVDTAAKKCIADAIGMNESKANNILSLDVGEAYVFFNDLSSAQLITNEDTREKENIRLSVSDNEVSGKSIYWKNRSTLLKPYKECGACKLCNDTCDFKTRADATYICEKTFRKYSSKLTNADRVKELLFRMKELMIDDFSNSTQQVDRLLACSKIKLMRKIELEKYICLNVKEKTFLIQNSAHDCKNNM